MRVLLVDQYGELGGAQQCLLDLLPALLKSGSQALLCAPPTGPLLELARTQGAETNPIALGAYSGGRKSLAEGFRFARESLAVRQVLNAGVSRFQPDVVYVNGPRALPAAALVARARGLPLVFHCHHRLVDPAALQLARRSLRIGRAYLISCCRFAGEPLAASVAEGRNFVVYNGVPGPSAAAAANRLDNSTVGVIGRISPEKGQAEFIEAVRQILKQDASFRSFICGSPLFDDPVAIRYEQSLKRASAGLPIEFMGWRNDVYAVLRDCAVAVVPSIREPATTRVILEAYSCGVPLVAFSSGGIPEVVRDGTTGLLVEPHTLAETLLDLLRDDSRRAELGRNGLAEWRKRFTMDRFQQEVLAVLNRASTAQSPPL